MKESSLDVLESGWFSFISEVSIALENTVIVSESATAVWLQKNVSVADTLTGNLKPRLNQTVGN